MMLLHLNSDEQNQQSIKLKSKFTHIGQISKPQQSN